MASAALWGCVPQAAFAQAAPSPPDSNSPDATTEGGPPELDLGPYEGFAAAPVFLPRSYLYWPSPSGERGSRQPLVLGVEYAFHLPLYNDLRAQAARGAPWAGAATLSFAGALRMLNAPSHPVRMPSYRPSLTAQVFRIHILPLPVIWGLGLELAHHSNGQEYCVFDASLEAESEACSQVIAAVNDPSEQLNRRSGNFSNNSVGLDFDVRVHWLDEKGVAIHHLATGIGLAANLPRGSGGLVEEMRPLYGVATLRTRVELQWSLPRAVSLRASVDLRHDFGVRADVPHSFGRLTLAVSPERLVGFGLFARYHGGRDFYNAFFVDRIQQLALGITWDAERPLRFATRPR